MHGRHSLEGLDQELLAALSRERQAEMWETACNAHRLGDERPGDQAARFNLGHVVLIALCVSVPIVLVVARAVAAANGGPIHMAF